MQKVTRTGKTQTELTATGIITTAEEIVKENGRKRTRWAQIGYTSIRTDVEGKKHVEGIYGQALLEG